MDETPGEGNVFGSTEHCCHKNSGKSHGSFVNESALVTKTGKGNRGTGKGSLGTSSQR